MVAYKSFEHKAWHMLMDTNSLAAIMLNSFLLPITEEVRIAKVKEPLALVLHITLNLNKNRVLLIKC